MATTVIVGCGIIGLSTAYYLSKHQPGSTIHLVDSSTELFASASGYAGGFIGGTKGFHFDPCVSALAGLSFDEHAKLAEGEGGRENWEYSKAVSLMYTRIEDGAGKKCMGGGKGRDDSRQDCIPGWLRRVDGDKVDLIDDGEGAAIVDPLKLCQFLLRKCKEEGVQIHHPATILSVGTDVRDEISCVCIGYTDSSTESEIPTTRILLSAGAWTPLVFTTLFKSATVDIPITSLAGHSLTVKKPASSNDANHLIFTNFPNSPSPELGTRPGGVIYFTGINTATIPLPPLATGAEKVQESLEQLKDLARELVDTEELDIVRTGLCFRPVTERGTPYIARLTDDQIGVKTRTGAEGGVFVAAGHGVWGILLSLGTGLVVAEMMCGKRTSVDVSGLGL